MFCFHQNCKMYEFYEVIQSKDLLWKYGSLSAHSEAASSNIHCSVYRSFVSAWSNLSDCRWLSIDSESWCALCRGFPSTLLQVLSRWRIIAAAQWITWGSANRTRCHREIELMDLTTGGVNPWRMFWTSTLSNVWMNNRYLIILEDNETP